MTAPSAATSGDATLGGMAEASTRQRMIETAVRLFCRQGYHATSWRTLVEEAGTPWGSAHHHFPGGKEQLGVAAIELGSRAIVGLIEKMFQEASGPAAAVRAYCRASAERLAASGYVEGCPVATVALEAPSESEALHAAVKAAFDEWREVMARHFVETGLPRRRAAQLASLVLGNIEGALLLARVSRSKEPLHVAGEHLADLITRELGELGARRS
jgi:TetR/AcrR family transcriptional regulator, lmrAB and yxaGH operons repressor